jgi:chemotaxis protein MotB
MMPAIRQSSSLRASGDRWLFGYADVVTLLFASFAALYATQVGAQPPSPPAPVLATTTQSAPPPATPSAESMLGDKLGDLVAASQGVGLELTARRGSLTLSVAEAGSFAQGRADLSDDAQRVLRQVAETLQAQPYPIRIEGHTDDLPIRTAAFASNWELSTARATRVVQFLIEECGLAPERLSAAGYAEHRPRVENLTADDRARNRRVDIVVLVSGEPPDGSDDLPR